MIPAGRYRARAVSWGLGETSSGKEQVAVEFEILDVDGMPGEHITWFGYFTDKTTARTVESLRICGWQGLDLSDLQGLDANEVSLVIEHEEYDGKWQARVKWVNAPGSGGGLALKSKLPEDKARAFAARMRGVVLAADASNGTKRPSAGAPPHSRSASARSPEPPPLTDMDDIPF